MTDAQVIRSIWIATSIFGLAFFIILLIFAQREVTYRRKVKGRRSLLLLAWKSFSIPAMLALGFLLDLVSATVSLFAPDVFISVGAFILSNVSRVVLGIYLLWSSFQVKKSGLSEIAAERARLLAEVKPAAVVAAVTAAIADTGAVIADAGKEGAP